MGAPLPPRVPREVAAAPRRPHVTGPLHALAAVAKVPDGEHEGVAPARVVRAGEPTLGAPWPGTKAATKRTAHAVLVVVVTRLPCAGRQTLQELGPRGQAGAIAIAEAASSSEALLMDTATRDPTSVLTGPLVETVLVLLRPRVPKARARQASRADGLAASTLVRRRGPIIPVPVKRLPIAARLAIRHVAPTAPGGRATLPGPTRILKTLAGTGPPTPRRPPARADTALIPDARRVPSVGLHLRAGPAALVVSNRHGAHAPVAGQLLPEGPRRVGVPQPTA